MTDSLYRFFWENSRYRASVYGVAVAGGTLYGTLGTLGFHKPGHRIEVELAVLLFLGVSIAVIVRHFLRQPTEARTLRGHLQYHAVLRIRSGVVALLILIGAQKVPIASVQAAIVSHRLQSAASAIAPQAAAHLPSDQLQAGFRKVHAIAATSIEYRISADNNVLQEVQNNLRETIEAINSDDRAVRASGVSAFVALIAYARFNSVLLSMQIPSVTIPRGNYLVSPVPLDKGSVWWQGSPEGSTILALANAAPGATFPISHSVVVFNDVNYNSLGLSRPFITADSGSRVVVMNSVIGGAPQQLDGIVWLKVRFENCRVLYNGGPVYLGEVSFQNCQFEAGDDPESQMLLAQVQAAAGQPITLVLGLSAQ